MPAKSALITGCSAGGIGHALAIAFQKRGLTVFATARSPSKISPDLASLPNVHLVTLDVTSPASITAAKKEIEAKTGGSLDILVNNAGGNHTMPVLDLNIEEAKDLFELNYWAAIRMVKEFGNMVIQAKGVFVNVGSIAGIVSVPMQSVYNASKAAVNSLSETLRLELAPLGVRVLTVIAGNVSSNIEANSNTVNLPKTSYYSSIEKNMQEPFPTDANLPTEKFVEWLADKTLSGASGKIWNGGYSGIVRWVVPWLPVFVADKILIGLGRGLDKLRPK